MVKKILIDGNNLAIRAAFANHSLTTTDGILSGLHYGVFQSLIKIKKTYPEHDMLLAWDSSSKRRKAEAKAAVETGLIPSGYKANRKKDEIPQPLQNFYDNHDILRRAIGFLGIAQIWCNGYEADDVIASYCSKFKNTDEIIAVTSDEDYYQLLHDNVKIWNEQKDLLLDQEWFFGEFGITPDEFIHAGALSGDTSDNIFGIPGWGGKTARKEIAKHKNYQNLVEEKNEKYCKLREEYPDLTDEDDFKQIQELTNNPEKPNSKKKFPEIYFGCPYSGVAKAIVEGKVKVPKSDIMLLMMQERVPLAYSLKKMDDDINVPNFSNKKPEFDKIMEYFEYFEIQALQTEISCFE